jgi:hypothetical protein
MSGPIVRKYGFPNFEKIFGERPLEHGVEEGEAAMEEAADTSSESPTTKPAPKKKATKSKKA